MLGRIATGGEGWLSLAWRCLFVLVVMETLVTVSSEGVFSCCCCKGWVLVWGFKGEGVAIKCCRHLVSSTKQSDGSEVISPNMKESLLCGLVTKALKVTLRS